MSNLEKRLQGKRTGPQSLLDKHELEKNTQLAYNYKVSVYSILIYVRPIQYGAVIYLIMWIYPQWMSFFFVTWKKYFSFFNVIIGETRIQKYTKCILVPIVKFF